MSEDIKAINARLKEIGKEYQDLAALKKKLVSQDATKNIQEKYGDYKFIVKKSMNQEITFDEEELKFTRSIYGLQAASYKVGPEQVGYHVAKTEEEADNIRIVEGLFKVGDKISELVKENKPLTAEEIIGMYDATRAGQQLEEPAESEEISE